MKTTLLIISVFLSASLFGQNQGEGVNDIDGNSYETVIIGNQEWMAENLRTTSYSNGDPILNLIGSGWQNLTSGAWTHYNDDNQFDIPYGKLYSWYTVSDSRDVCPSGWHVPKDSEWNQLVINIDPAADTTSDYLNDAGGAMKSMGNLQAANGLWMYPNTGATNTSGFSGLPGGSIDYGFFFSFSEDGYWWSTTEYQNVYALYRGLHYGNDSFVRYDAEKASGLSIRCVKGLATSIDENKPNNLTVHPNPTSDQITIDIEGYDGPVNLEVYDLQGRLLETTTNTIVSLKKHANRIFLFILLLLIYCQSDKFPVHCFGNIYLTDLPSKSLYSGLMYYNNSLSSCSFKNDRLY